MSDQSRADDAPAIRCRNVWQVFGPDAAAQLSTAQDRAKGNPEAAARILRKEGLVPAVQDVSFDVKPGEIFVIMGLSGSGKSTILRCISRLIEVTAGRIDIDGEDILHASKTRMTHLRRRKLGMVFQHFGLFPHMNVAQNVAFPLKMQKQHRAERAARAQEMINLVGLEGREEAYPRELSGGQRQRVGIARSLAVNPDVWFLDEPFSALDPLIRRQLQDEFIGIQARLRKTIIFITHDIAEALKVADRIAIMRDGQIVQIGPPSQIVLAPVDGYVRDFTRDVPKGRHARLSSVLHPVDPQAPPARDDPGLRVDMTLDEALDACMSLYRPVPVRGRDGRIVGMIDPVDLSRALQADP